MVLCLIIVVYYLAAAATKSVTAGATAPQHTERKAQLFIVSSCTLFNVFFLLYFLRREKRNIFGVMFYGCWTFLGVYF